MTLQTTWLPAPADLRTAAGRVDIWRAQLSVAPAVLARLAAHLDQTERARAGRFVFERDANRFVVARGILRELVARYLERSPAELEFEYGPRGKPVLRAGAGLCFNVSHSHEMAAYAFARDRQLGIDIELIRADFAGQEIAERYFSRSEVAELTALPGPARAQAFFLCWTRKEAYIKALGEGFEIPLKSFSVSLTPGGPDELRSADASRWELDSFEPAPGYAGALVAEGRALSIGYWDWAA
ncbi:MAG TPA: 4'-phosphopantetheinyl transferase superfamily protein [Candidatus Cybelea sp.]|nr:4'-phosphopantetheinyl transferase superfamily protein [Candidatus Cybelea sp.]